MELRLWRWSEPGWTTKSVWNYSGCLLFVALSAWSNPTGEHAKAATKETQLWAEDGGK